MKSLIFFWRFFLLLVLGLGTLPLCAQVLVPQKPQPPLGLTTKQPCQNDKTTWIPSRWKWDTERKAYVWLPGECVPLKKGHIWVQGLWRKEPEGWRYLPGRWKKI